ncbi:MAG: hypothetical protein IT381_32325 [Deltaproteobacteria bacterium]|nr:hypothetical protein [Deltaproteobacteria bacterium]
MANEPRNTSDSLHDFFATLARGQVIRRLPSELLALARHARLAVRADANVVAAEDLLQELFAQICERARRLNQRVAEDLASLGGRELRSALRTRLRQAAYAKSSTWNQRRALADQVRAAFAGDVSVPVADKPTTLTSGDRLCGELVRLAVRWAVAKNGVGFDEKRVLSCLWSEYFQREQAETATHHCEDSHEEFIRPRMGETLRRGIERSCGEELSRAFVARYRGRGYQEIAASEDISVATAFSRVERATAIVRELGCELGASPQNVVDALELLAA